MNIGRIISDENSGISPVHCMHEGVIPPECLEPRVREAFLAELAEKDIIIHERVKRRLG